MKKYRFSFSRKAEPAVQAKQPMKAVKARKHKRFCHCRECFKGPPAGGITPSEYAMRAVQLRKDAEEMRLVR